MTQTVSVWDGVEVRVGTDEALTPDPSPSVSFGAAPGRGEGTASPAIALSVSGPFPAPADETNLCWRAAEAFMRAFGAPVAVDIHLTKNVPAGTGLGGGSSDCAATLVALSCLTGLGTPDELRDLAASLGSDTVLFLDGGAALGSGRGEVVEPLPAPREYHLVIARPDVHVSTREAYSGLGPEDFSDGSRVARLAWALCAGAAAGELSTLLHNAFRPKAAARHPQIAGLIAEMLELGAIASELTGSGSGVFGLVESAREAEALAEALSARGYWSVAAHTVDRGHEFVEVTQAD